MLETVQYQYNKAGYSVIKLNRVEKHNAISNEMISALKNCLEQVKQDDIKCLVITGSGDKMFCAGGDLINFHGELTPDEAFSHLYPMKEVLYEIASFPIPTICLLNGDALGGGCEIATACDFRIAKETTKFGFVQSKLGIVPGWGGGTLLYEKVHPTFAYQWIMEGEIFDASTLKEQGWIHHIIPEEEWGDYDSILKTYLSKSTAQMHYLKSQYLKKMTALALSAQMNEEVRNCANLWDSAEHKEAVEKFMNRNK
ncbi:MAG TPA: enoyl-CoA hydratase/isomerase family protein [Virgibacillus sp.]|nr:enoyl-CoA hydratase/isomerase family protein [Virgibacillus sp.]